MDNEQLALLFPEGFPIIPPGVIHLYPNPIIQVYLNEWRGGKISMEAAYCSIIHCLLKQVDQLEGFIANPTAELRLVEPDETKQDNQDSYQPICNTQEQQAPAESKEGTSPDDKAG